MCATELLRLLLDFLAQNRNAAKNVRIADALGEIGPSVVVGAATTFVGIMPMVFARNHVFRVFFKMFIIIIGFGVRTPRTYIL